MSFLVRNELETVIDNLCNEEEKEYSLFCYALVIELLKLNIWDEENLTKSRRY